MAADSAVGKLAGSWEGDRSIRQNARELGQITKWKKPELVGVPSSNAMTYNTRVLELLADWWTVQVSEPQAVPIDTLRSEVSSSEIV